MPTDPVWRVIARESGEPVSLVMSVFLVHMVNASQSVTRDGVTHGIVTDEIACLLDATVPQITAIIESMQGRVLDGPKLTGWEKRQPKREDRSRERTRKWRAKKTRRSVTQRDAPDSDSDSDIKKEYTDHFALFWKTYPSRAPHQNPKKPARQKFDRAVANGVDPGEIIAAADRYADYAATLEDRKMIAQAVTWLNQERWNDGETSVPLPSLEPVVADGVDGRPWLDAWDKLAEKIGAPFRALVAPLEFAGRNGSGLVLVARTKFQADYVRTHCVDQISAVMGCPVTVREKHGASGR